MMIFFERSGSEQDIIVYNSEFCEHLQTVPTSVPDQIRGTCTAAIAERALLCPRIPDDFQFYPFFGSH